jgi:hypothetical protein
MKKDTKLKKYLFNWYELYQDGDKDFTGILILAHALTVEYNNKIAWNTEDLYRKLHVNKIPTRLLKFGHLYTNRYGGILTKYKCTDPQCYFYNTSFLYATIPESKKGQYLFILSQRSIDNEDLFIPDYYVDEKLWKNPLIQHKDNKLYFIPELAYFDKK